MHTQKRPVATGAKRKKVAEGKVYLVGRRRIVVDFDDDIFDAIRQRAIAQNTSFAEQVHTLVQWGLDEDDDCALSNDLAPCSATNRLR